MTMYRDMDMRFWLERANAEAEPDATVTAVDSAARRREPGA